MDSKREFVLFISGISFKFVKVIILYTNKLLYY